MENIQVVSYDVLLEKRKLFNFVRNQVYSYKL